MGKGAETRERIVGRAMTLASRDGLAGLTIGALATDLGLSKSGLFAHFGSKEELQLAALQEAAARFTTLVITPALKAPRGEPRLRALLDRWLSWGTDAGLHGCLFMAAAAELDDATPGPVRDELVATMRRIDEFLAKAVRLGIEAGQFRKDTDPDQVAFELRAHVYAFHYAHRLMADPRAAARTRAAVDRLFASLRA